MFQQLFRRAQASLESSIGHVLERAIIAVPFIVAAGFATAAVAIWLSREFDVITVNILMALIFFVLGLMLSVILWSRRHEQPAAEEAAATAPASTDNSNQAAGFSDTERELLMAALTSAAPLAIPHVARLLLRNLPLVATIAVAGYVLSRQTGDVAGAPPAMEPAE